LPFATPDLFFWIVEEAKFAPIMTENNPMDWPILGRPQVAYFEALGDRSMPHY
jgi:hypothetical protein